MLETDTTIFYLIGISEVEINASDGIIMNIFVALYICFRTPFVCLLNDFTEVYSYLWMAVYMIQLAPF